MGWERYACVERCESFELGEIRRHVAVGGLDEYRSDARDHVPDDERALLRLVQAYVTRRVARRVEHSPATRNGPPQIEHIAVLEPSIDRSEDAGRCIRVGPDG